MLRNKENQKRIINVSNRLPIKITSVEGRISYQNSEGGLATGLGSVFSHYENMWIGWPGMEIADSRKKHVTEELHKHKLHPVFLTKDEINNFYEGFSNEIVWPLFHYFPTYSVYNPQYWDTYVEVNKKYAEEILRFATEDDLIWIQDYHLMLLPQLLREAMPGLTIGYFQHIPFPSFDLFKALPWKDKIVEGLLGADVVGFQTNNDVKHFIDAASQLVDVRTGINNIVHNDRRICVEAFPISIDYQKYNELAKHNASKKIAQKLRKTISTKIVVSIDRLDYSKGIIQRLQAYDLFLKEHPEYLQKVTYIHLVVPSRENVGQYKSLKEEMNRLISEINGKYATLSWQPIRHFYRSFPPNLLSALYRSADLALVTPLVDGMNLVSKEYVASNVHQNGALILGEGAGAAKELTEAIIINPNDVSAFAESIYHGLSMPEEQKQDTMKRMQEKIQNADIFQWAKNFLTKLSPIKERATHAPLQLSGEIIAKIDKQYATSNRRLILLDYDGTVVPFFKKPEDAYPSTALLKVLKELASDSRNDVVIISGRDSATLEKWLGHLPVKIVAEHGAWFKDDGENWHPIPHLQNEWKDVVNQTFTSYSVDAPGTFIEEKTYSVAWHYRAAKTAIDDKYIKEIVGELKKVINKDVDVLLGNKVIEVKNKAINKGNAVLKLMSKKRYDFVMAIGDDKTDEDMFKVLPKDTFTIKVGNDHSFASYFQPSYKEVNLLLKEISEKNRNSVSIS